MSQAKWWLTDDAGASRDAPRPSSVSPRDGGAGDLLAGTSAAMRRVREQLAAVARVPWPVRLEGERGTGKNVAARLLHRLARPDTPFVEVNIAAISAGAGRELGEFVGWRRGAFTGAEHDHPGLLEAAHTGTAFLNEIGTASPAVQLILLRLMERGAVIRLGEHRERRLDVRLVTATNEDLEEAVRRHTFRADLYDRLGQLVVRIPPLRERLEDIPILIATILQGKAAAANVAPRQLEHGDLERLLGYDWPGNVRELETTIEYVLVFGHLPESLTRAVGRAHNWRPRVLEALARHGGNKRAAARELGIARSTLYEAIGAGVSGSREPDTDRTLLRPTDSTRG